MSRTTTERTPTTPHATTRSAGSRRRVPRWTVPFAAAAAGLVTWLAGAAAGVGPVVVATGGGEQSVSAVSVVAAGIVAGFGGWGVRAAIGRVARRRSSDATRTGEAAWLVTCAVVLLVSLTGPLGAASAGATALLVAEHVLVGSVIALGLRR